MLLLPTSRVILNQALQALCAFYPSLGLPCAAVRGTFCDMITNSALVFALLVPCPCRAGGSDTREGAGLEAVGHSQFTRSPPSPREAEETLPGAGARAGICAHTGLTSLLAGSADPTYSISQPLSLPPRAAAAFEQTKPGQTLVDRIELQNHRILWVGSGFKVDEL